MYGIRVWYNQRICWMKKVMVLMMINRKRNNIALEEDCSSI